ncbi:serine/threonine-protein kinase [Streptomyces sp. NA02536]|uniref:serine/threonine-protein kinase n=1 Tax=Streptomyces sp. NA02536 TaxID=2742133 RepID=UPI0015912500|nr:serine/threonine-protein kinase [Streptomyces sp. NA02536]QKW04218.1 serine/threonine protein kinase [Streptomyces sp. NA02536]
MVDGDAELFFELEGRDYLLTFVSAQSSWHGHWEEFISRRLDSGLLRDRRWVLLYLPDHDPQTDKRAEEQLVTAIGTSGVVLDGTHLEAALTGLYPLADLIQGAFRQHQAYTPLADLLTTDGSAADERHMTPAARLTSPVRVETTTWAGAAADILLIGQRQKDRPTGLALQSDRTALLTCPDGLLNVDLARGHARWHLPLPGCHGAPLIREDGAVWVMCGSVLVRWHHGRLDAVAGGFEDGAVLLPGPDGEPWVLSGSGVTFRTGDGTLALTRAGVRAGEQLRYPITFNASVRSALWLDRRRFFLAASGHSAVVDLARTTDAGQRDDWIRTPVSYPGHVLRAGIDSVITASPDGTGIGVGLHRTDITSRTSEPLLHTQLGEILGLAQDPSDGPAYLLASLPDNDPTHVRPVLMRLTGHRTSPPKTPPAPIAPAVGYDAVSQAARGERRDYRLDRLPLAREGQAEVFRAEHKDTGTVVAFKKRTGRGERDARRMRREVAAALRFGGNPHVMPVLDFSPAHDWFVMPLAEATVEDKRIELQNPTQLHTLVGAVAAGLADAHRDDWIHRDIKPSNVLLLNGRWTVADWGIVRRPRGETSTAGLLTRAGIGTEGFAAPELSVDGHDITPASDIYSLGQLIGWIFTGTWPQANMPMLPPPGPWYGVVRQATQLDPAQRPQNIDAFLALVERETGSQDELPIIRAARLLKEANERDDTATAAQLLTLAADQPDSYELYLDVVTKLDVRAAETALLANPQQTTDVLKALTGHAVGDRGDWATNEEATRAIWWLLKVARLAAQEEQWPMLDAAVQGMCDWDGRWDRWDPRNSIRNWLITLTGHAAATVASALRAQPHGARFYHEVKDNRRADIAIRSAIHAAQGT